MKKSGYEEIIEYKNLLKREIKDILSIKYIICVLMTTFLGYGFYLTHVTVNVDCLAHSLYFDDRNIMLAAERWGSTFWFKILCWDDFYPCLTPMLGVLCFLTAVVSFSVLFRVSTDGKTKGGAEILFSCVLITYPLISEIWNYDGCLFYIGIGYTFVALSLLLMENKKHIIAASLLLMLAIAGYESFAAVYVAGVLIVVFLENFYCKKHEGIKNCFYSGMIYAIPLVVGLVLKYVVGRIWRVSLGLEKFVVNTTEISWFDSKNMVSILLNLIKALVSRHFVFGLWYFPVLEFAVATAVMVLIIVYLIKHCKKIELIILFIGIWMCNFLLSLIAGGWTGYRTCQVAGLFVAFVFMLSYQLVRKSRKYIYVAFTVCMVWVCYIQTSVLAKHSILNYERSEEEAAAVRMIGYEISQRNPDNKPIIFVGEYQLNDRIKDHIRIKEGLSLSLAQKFYAKVSGKPLDEGERFFTESMIRSNLEWSVSVFGNQDIMLKLFQYYGYDYLPVSDEIELKDAEEYADKNMESWPRNGFYYEGEDYVIIKLGEID